MINFSEVIKIIEAGLDGDRTKLIAYANLLTNKVGERQSQMIKDRITGKYKTKDVLRCKTMKIKKVEVVEYDDGTTKELNKLSGSDWSLLLCDQPQFIDKADLNKLTGRDWSWLLCDQPQFIDKADLSKLDGRDWSCLLRVQPQLEKYNEVE